MKRFPASGQSTPLRPELVALRDFATAGSNHHCEGSDLPLTATTHHQKQPMEGLFNARVSFSRRVERCSETAAGPLAGSAVRWGAFRSRPLPGAQARHHGLTRSMRRSSNEAGDRDNSRDPTRRRSHGPAGTRHEASDQTGQDNLKRCCKTATILTPVIAGFIDWLDTRLTTTKKLSAILCSTEIFNSGLLDTPPAMMFGDMKAVIDVAAILIAPRE